MRRREFLGCTGAAALSVMGGGAFAQSQTNTPAPPAPQRPNIIFVLIDDMGCRDVGCFGSTFYETPNIDRLAASGVRFTQAYAACPVCSPTRASIVTGKYPARLQLTNFLKGTLSPKDSPVLTAPYADQLALEEVTTAEILRNAGYRTAHVGKWHLGGKGFWPEEQGYDVNIAGGASGMPKSYFWPGWGENPPIKGNYEGEYLTDRLTEEACHFIENNREQPFFLSLCHFSVHIPIQAKADKCAKYQAKLQSNPPATGQQNNPYYAAMVESVDDSIGQLMETLKRCGIEDRTAIFFFSDNGGLSVHEGDLTPATTNAPFRNGKGFLHEGGIREPLIVTWPGVTPPGRVCDTPVCSIDFLPSICAMASASPEATGARNLDGLDVTPLLRDPGATLPREALYWHYPHFANQGGRPSGAIRMGDWKLIENYEFGGVELYNLRDDISETRNLAQAEPVRVNEMLEKLHAWRKEVGATMPPTNPEYPKNQETGK